MRTLPIAAYRVEDEPPAEKLAHALQLLLADTIATSSGTRIIGHDTFVALKRYLCLAMVQLEGKK